MSFTFDIFSVKSVQSDYSWDKGTPNLDYTDFLTNLSACSSSSSNSEGVEYVGYAPFVFVSLSSAPGEISESHIALKRIANFGDYYNSETNIVATPTLSSESFCHCYIMPGLYSITFDRIEYIEATVEETFKAFGNCLQRHCIDWSWKTLATCTEDFSVTWSSTLTGNTYEKLWKFEPCDAEWAASNGLFIEKPVDVVKEERNPLSWQWYNFACVSDSPYNTPTTWLSAAFQRPDQLNWIDTAGPCVTIQQNLVSQTLWTWLTITSAVSADQNVAAVTWDETSSSLPGHTTWDYIKDNCGGASTAKTVLSSSTQTVRKEAFIRVLEIPPTAYLKVTQPSSRTSPMVVRLSPSDTVCGSFPIEKIVWDLGDGSPLLVQRRWSNTLEAPFVYSGALSEDYQDPRNYDVVHTYTRTPNEGFCFYPSITAYASSTDSNDCAAAVVGPIKFAPTTGSNFKLLQNELTEHGKVLIGQIDNNVAVWRADK